MAKSIEEARKALGARIVELRKGRGLSAKDLANAADMSASFLSAVEHGRKAPTIDTMVRLSEVLDVSLAELVGGSEIRLRREIEDLIQRVPARRRIPLLHVIRDSIVLLVEDIRQREARKAP